MEEVYDPSASVAELEERIRTVREFPNECSIVRVPTNLRRVSESAYSPIQVSIGPLHHGSPQLAEMENHKIRYLRSCFRRERLSFPSCVRYIQTLEERVRNNYYEHQFNHPFTTNQFVNMLIVDSIFVLELMMLHFKCNRDRVKPDHVRHTEEHDQIFLNPLVFKNVYEDLCLLENQLPYFLLDALYHFIGGFNSTEKSLDELVAHFFQLDLSKLHLVLASGTMFKHFVDFHLCFYYENSYFPKHRNNIDRRFEDSAEGKQVALLNITELMKGGIKLNKSPSTSFVDITFSDGVLSIPDLYFGPDTEGRIRNLVAYGQCTHGGSCYMMTDFALLMDSLIKTPEDVAILRSRGIVNNHLGGDKDLSDILNDVGKGINRYYCDFYYYDLYKEMNEYCELRLRRRIQWPAMFCENYCSNPFKVFSVFVAIVLLACSIIQTVGTVKGFKKK